jgi:HEAT repeat protein
MRDVRAIESLIEALQDESIRGAVADALAEIGDRRALEPLLQIQPHSKYYASMAVKAAIKTLQTANEPPG